MKMTIRAICGALLGMVLMACTTNQITGTAQLALEAKLADMLVTNGQAPSVVMSVDLNTNEVNTVNDALDVYSGFREKWGEAIEDPALALENLITLSLDYADLYASYTAVRQVVLNHWGDYTPVQRAEMQGYHERALSIHQRVQTLFQEGDSNETIRQVLQMGLLIARVAAV